MAEMIVMGWQLEKLSISLLWCLEIILLYLIKFTRPKSKPIKKFALINLTEIGIKKIKLVLENY